ncbi:DUF3237 domain-containing protein [Micromonospora sp. WMMD1155]|uniref:DUF3237 domain-containing protein n=1 Tax=Micromonospora sp. WMMD1155 TaxID=3016094 RepID=UPI00249A5798|nr:DUF3237 domain-containing protein [Micromonospora sp. WMMD1155]WFE48800.1 DUF3237 domain-containing protein [Micromonospora sp. WMMD1155]WFE54952.1 DUF3237 domain-containing protein [Micromonospora sp. WMMD1155]
MKLEEIFRMTVAVTPPIVIGHTPLGLRQVIGSSGGTVVGARISGRLNSGGGDWLLVTGDGYARPDVRHTVHTDDGADLYLHGTGLIEMNDATRAAISGGAPTDFDDAYLRLGLAIESGDPRYSWVNRALFLAEGRIQEGPTIEYVVHQVL